MPAGPLAKIIRTGAALSRAEPMTGGIRQAAFVPEAFLRPYRPRKTLNQDLFPDPSQPVLRQEIRDRLSKIADEFVAATGIDPAEIEDIQLVGSNASYAYRDGSDLDVHIILRPRQGLSPAELERRKTIQAKAAAFKQKYKDRLHIEDYPVEVGAEERGGATVAEGRYSLKNDAWAGGPPAPPSGPVPGRQAVAKAASDLIDRINAMARSEDPEEIDKFLQDVYKTRRTRFVDEGEWGLTNLAFKVARNRGLLQKLHDRVLDLKSARLSLTRPQDPLAVRMGVPVMGGAVLGALDPGYPEQSRFPAQWPAAGQPWR